MTLFIPGNTTSNYFLTAEEYEPDVLHAPGLCGDASHLQQVLEVFTEPRSHDASTPEMDLNLDLQAGPGLSTRLGISGRSSGELARLTAGHSAPKCKAATKRRSGAERSDPHLNELIRIIGQCTTLTSRGTYHFPSVTLHMRIGQP